MFDAGSHQPTGHKRVSFADVPQAGVRCGLSKSDVCRVRYVQSLRRNRVQKVRLCSISPVFGDR
jgi:hypothetical protein